jgi:exonuclease 3'-5' domain-containing protein 1
MASIVTITNNDLLKSIERIQSIKLEDDSSYTVVDSDSALSDMIDTLADLPVTPPSIYVDLEGVNLSR